jgi:predicted lipoprotein with Yx(FWY)xxD motif
MKRMLGFALAAIGAAMLIVALAQAGTHRQSAGVVVSVRKTALGSVLVDSRGRTLYLFEKDRNGLSMCSSACTAYWPPLTSHVAPRAGSGVHKQLLTLGKAHNGVRQVLYAGHPLYTFVGDTHAGQTSGEGLTNFGAGWYAIAASGLKVDKSDSASGGSGSGSGSGSGGGYGSGYGSGGGY